MKRRSRRLVPEISLSINEVARLFDVDRRTVTRWTALGLPRDADGRFNFPTCGLWYQVWRHRCDNRCQRHPEADLMFLLARAMWIMPQRVRSLRAIQVFVRQTCGFELSQETLERIRNA
jgi:hypothetical protein